MEDYDVLHLKRQTLLDFILDDNPLSPRKCIVSRLLYAGRNVNRECNKVRLTNYHSEMLQKIAGKMDKISGFLLVYPTCCLHLLEADTSVLMAILKNLQTDASNVDSVCILSFSEMAPYRFYPGWTSGFINSSNLGPYEAVDEAFLLSTISSLSINVLKWGKTLSEMDKAKLLQALESVRSTAEEFLPDDPTIIFGIILAAGTPKLQEFMELYDLPPEDIVFEKDLVWPMPEEPFRW